MNQPIQHHYLPAKAYLKLFAISSEPDCVFMYQRGHEPIALPIDQVARERYLYAFDDGKGGKDTGLESALGEMEQLAAPILQKLETATASFELTLDEKNRLALFVAFQTFRTPAHIGAIGNLTADMMTRMMKTRHEDKSVFDQTLDEVERQHPELPKEGKEKLREAFEAGAIQIKVNPEYAMSLSMGPALDVVPAVMMKDMLLVKAPEGHSFITSDAPVCLVRRLDYPIDMGGFAFSNIVFPIGKSTVLVLANPESLPTHPDDSPRKVHISMATPKRIAETNALTVQNAERFLFGPGNIPEIKALFDQSEPPKRFSLT